MKKLGTIAVACLALGGCVQAGGTAFYGTVEVPDRGSPAFCENYAEQTYRNSFNDLYDPGEGYGSRAFARAKAERDADAAFARCQSGRLN